VRKTTGNLALAMLVATVATLAPADSSDKPSRHCVGNTCFDTTTVVASQPLPLAGAGLLRYWGFRLYTAAFYAPEGTDTPAEALADVPRELELRYHRRITREQIVEATIKALDRQRGIDRDALAERFDRVYDLFATVDDGDCFEVIYEPGKGTSIVLNGTVRGTIEGADFAAAFFGIWLSYDPLSDELRDKLLGRKK
jgi:hypothetical protein